MGGGVIEGGVIRGIPETVSHPLLTRTRPVAAPLSKIPGKLSKEFSSPGIERVMFTAQVIQAILHRPLPDSAPLHRTPPQLNELLSP